MSAVAARFVSVIVLSGTLAALSMTAGPSRAQHGPALVIPGNGAAYDAQSRHLVRHTELLESIDRRLANLEKVTGVVPQRPGADRAAAQQQVMLRACAGCHTPAQQDGGFILFADNTAKALKPMSARELETVTDRISRGNMPPKKAERELTVAERQLFQ